MWEHSRSISHVMAGLPTLGICAMHGIDRHICTLYTASEDRSGVLFHVIYIVLYYILLYHIIPCYLIFYLIILYHNISYYYCISNTLYVCIYLCRFKFFLKLILILVI